MIGKIIQVQQKSEIGWTALIRGEIYSSECLTLGLYLDDVFFKEIKPTDQINSDKARLFEFLIGNVTLLHLPRETKIKVISNPQNTEIEFNKDCCQLIHGESCDSILKFKDMLDTQYQVDHWGNIQRTFGKNPELKQQFLQLYKDWQTIIESELGLKLYVVGGALLGIMRQGDFLDHDDDIDAAILLQANSYEDANKKFYDFFDEIRSLIDLNRYNLRICNPGHCQIFCLKHSITLDIFASWFNSNGEFLRVIGTTGKIDVNDCTPKKMVFQGIEIYVPANPEIDLAWTYGPNWREPDPYFKWVLDEDSKMKMQKFREIGWNEFKARQI